MDVTTTHQYRPPFGKQQVQQSQSAPAASDPLSFRTARDQLEIDEARTKPMGGGGAGGGVVKKSLGMHSAAK